MIYPVFLGSIWIFFIKVDVTKGFGSFDGAKLDQLIISIFFLFFLSQVHGQRVVSSQFAGSNYFPDPWYDLDALDGRVE